MGAFAVDCELQELTGNQPPVRVADVMVDTGSEYTWLPEDLLVRAGVGVSKKDLAFVMANGVTVTRHVGYAYLRSSGFETVDEVVFARPGDPRLLGARTIEGFAAPVDARRKRLVASGPLPAAANDPAPLLAEGTALLRVCAPAPRRTVSSDWRRSVDRYRSFARRSSTAAAKAGTRRAA